MTMGRYYKRIIFSCVCALCFFIQGSVIALPQYSAYAIENDFLYAPGGWSNILFNKLIEKNGITETNSTVIIQKTGLYNCSLRTTMNWAEGFNPIGYVNLRIQTNGDNWVRSLETYDANDAGEDTNNDYSASIVCGYPSILQSGTIVNVQIKSPYWILIYKNTSKTYFSVWELCEASYQTNTITNEVINMGPTGYFTNALGYLYSSNVVESINLQTESIRDIRVILSWVMGVVLCWVVVYSWPWGKR